MRTGFLRTLCVPLLVLASLTLCSAPALAGPAFTAFGPRVFARGTSTATFSVPNPAAPFTMRIAGSGQATVRLNGTPIAGPSDFSSKGTVIERTVMVAGSNTLVVDVKGSPAETLSIEIVGSDQDRPVVTVTAPADLATLNASPAIVLGTAHDATSGIALVRCNGVPATFGANASFSCSAPITDGTNVLVIDATDRAGHSTTIVRQVVLTTAWIEVRVWNQFELVWADVGSGGFYDGAYHKPVNLPAGFFPLGDYGQGDHAAPRGTVLIAKELRPGALAAPAGWSLVWDDAGSGADGDVAFWKPSAPEGYVCLGTVAQPVHQVKPDAGRIRCVRNDLTAPGRIGPWIWSDNNTHANVDFGSWQVVPADATGTGVGTFSGSVSEIMPDPGPLYTLRAATLRRED